MGSCCSTTDDYDGPYGNNAAEEEEPAVAPAIKFLFLGAGESGKTTLFKQIQINYLASYSSDLLQNEKTKIQHSVRVQFSDLIAVLYSLGNVSEDMQLQAISDKYFPLTTAGVRVSPTASYNDEVISFMRDIWNSERGQQVWRDRSRYALTDSLEYFMNNLDRVTSSDYAPTEMDFLKCRIRTTGATEQTFLYRGVSLYVVDVGGQRSERRKWMKCFDGVTAVLFVASVSDFDQVLYEEVEVKRLPDAIDLFSRTVKSPFFKTTPFVLFLNKQDLLEEKLNTMERAGQNLDDFFPELGMGTDYTDAFSKVQQHLKGLFMNSVPPERRDYIFPHEIVATDRGNFQKIFDAATTIILHDALNDVE